MKTYFICDNCKKRIDESEDVPHYREGHDNEDLCEDCFNSLKTPSND